MIIRPEYWISLVSHQALSNCFCLLGLTLSLLVLTYILCTFVALVCSTITPEQGDLLNRVLSILLEERGWKNLVTFDSHQSFYDGS